MWGTLRRKIMLGLLSGISLIGCEKNIIEAVVGPGKNGVRGTNSIDLESEQCEETNELRNEKDPFVGFKRYTKKAWYIDWEGSTYELVEPNYGSHFNDSLVRVGLRDAIGEESGDEDIKSVNASTRAFVQKRTLEYLSGFYGNNKDGTMKPGGFAISFVGPCDKAALESDVNTICLGYRPGDKKFLGAAYIDENDRGIEHNCSTENEFLGVSMPGIDDIINTSWHTIAIEMRKTPVNPNDKNLVKGWLYDAPIEGSYDPVRYHYFFETVDNYSFSLARVLAHEIAHSLGLLHKFATKEEDIMSALMVAKPVNPPGFGPISRTYLAETVGYNGGFPASIQNPAPETRITIDKK